MESSEEGEVKYKDFTKIHNHRFDYKIIKKVGEGTFGQVYLSIFRDRKYALKRVPTDLSTGLSVTSIREISILKRLKHKNIIEVLDIIYDKDENDDFDRNKISLYIVFPFYEYDLFNYIQRRRMNIEEIKDIGRQILNGLKYLHKNNVIHRDLKSANILLNSNMDIKIADFGLARILNCNENLTPGVVTLWYRSPELLLGDKKYTFAVDIWSFGCILGEMFTGKPILKADKDIEQLYRIISLCGSINERTFKGFYDLKYSRSYNLPQGVSNIEIIFSKFDKNLSKCLKKILTIDPKERPDCDQVLSDTFFVITQQKRRSEGVRDNSKMIRRNGY